MTPTPLEPYLPLAIVLLLAGVLALVIVGLSSILGPRRPSIVKSSQFECGSETVGDARQRFAVKFYVVALLFVVFDVEVVFMYPWAVRFREMGWYGFWVMAVFGIPLVVSIIYEWRKGALNWEES